jgi:hypothetical protein
MKEVKPVVTRTRKSTKYVFTLKNINVEKIDQKYGITIISNISHNIEQPNNTTTLTELSELNKNTSLDIVSFLDESKRTYQCNISMIDFSTQHSVELLKYKCYWCKHSFETTPIGCPLNYVSSRVKKTYHSEVSKDNYTITENITKCKRELIYNPNLFMTKNKASISINKEEYYETDGIFCSFNCCKAFIKDNKHINIYDHSDNLLNKLYIDMNISETTTLKNIKINPAPHWRLLKDYGGHLSINEFRDNFNKCTYDFYGTIKSQSLFKPIGMLFEEKINF